MKGFAENPARLPRPTALVESPRLSGRLGARVLIASETLQHTGSFKFRAALNVAAKVPRQRIIAASSGNFGAALAYACALPGKSCVVVMPTASARVKVDAVLEYGGAVDLEDVRANSRAARVAELAAADPGAYVASAYDDPLVIEGNAGLGLGLAAWRERFRGLTVCCVVSGGNVDAEIFQGLLASG